MFSACLAPLSALLALSSAGFRKLSLSVGLLVLASESAFCSFSFFQTILRCSQSSVGKADPIASQRALRLAWLACSWAFRVEWLQIWAVSQSRAKEHSHNQRAQKQVDIKSPLILEFLENQSLLLALDHRPHELLSKLLLAQQVQSHSQLVLVWLPAQDFGESLCGQLLLSRLEDHAGCRKISNFFKLGLVVHEQNDSIRDFLVRPVGEGNDEPCLFNLEDRQQSAEVEQEVLILEVLEELEVGALSWSEVMDVPPIIVEGPETCLFHLSQQQVITELHAIQLDPLRVLDHWVSH